MRHWPEFDNNGDLPKGIHHAKLAEVVEHFGSRTAQRRMVAARLQSIYELAQSTVHLARFIIFGSFVTAKPEPKDIDLFLLMDDSFDKNKISCQEK